MGPRFTGNADALRDLVSSSVGGLGIPCVHHMVPEHLAFIDPDAVSPLSLAAHSGIGLASAIWDGVECGIQAVEEDTETPRRVVLVFTDAQDNASTTSSNAITELADQIGRASGRGRG